MPFPQLIVFEAVCSHQWLATEVDEEDRRP
jgi:hypothetical protein